MNREECTDRLIKEFDKLSCWKEMKCGRNVVKFDGTNEPLPPYVPQIGDVYFSPDNRPKILGYAMNQNLAKDTQVVEEYTEFEQAGNHHKVLNRMNGTHESGNPNVQEYMGPYPHMNMLMRLVHLTINDETLTSKECLQRTACTNLIKCSTDKEPSTPNTIMYENCIAMTCSHEIRELAPELVIAMGEDVFNSLTDTLGFTAKNDCGTYSVPSKFSDSAGPKLVIYAYHSTGSILQQFKPLQQYMEEGGSRPRQKRPYLEMLTGQAYNESDDYWNAARSTYEEYRKLLTSKYVKFFERKEWCGANKDWLFYFACHLSFFQRVLNEQRL